MVYYQHNYITLFLWCRIRDSGGLWQTAFVFHLRKGERETAVLPDSQSTEQGSEWCLEPSYQAHTMLLILKGVSFPGTHAVGFGASQLLSLSSCDSGHCVKLRVLVPSHVSGANTLSARLYVRPCLVEYSRLLCQCGLEDREMAGVEKEEYNSLHHFLDDRYFAQ